jgi:hypothetical protein
MRALDPAAGPVERFACELRALRAAAGEPTFGKMARRCEVSKSSLAAAVAGYQLPSERVARDFVQACGGHWPWWSARLAKARAAFGPTADAPATDGSQHTTISSALVPVHRMPLVPARSRGELVVRTISPSSLPARPLVPAGSQRRARRHRIRGRQRVIVLAAVALVVLALTAVPPSGTLRAAPLSSPRTTPPSTPTRSPATVATAIPVSVAPRAARAAPLLSPQSTPPSTPTGPSATIDLVRVVYGTKGDSHVTAQLLSLTAGQLGQLDAMSLGDSASYEAWFTAHGAIDLGTTVVQIIVEGNRDHQVRIVDLQPVATCSAPLTGTLFLSPPAGGETTTQLFADLDSPSRTLRYTIVDQHGGVTTGQDYFGDFTVSLARGEQQVFELAVSSGKHYCTFTLDMTVVDGGHTVVEHISDDGRPFAVSALAPHRTTASYSSYSMLYIGGTLAPNNGWVREDPNTYQ